MIKLVSKRSIPLALRKLVWNTYIGKHKGTAKCQCCNHEEIQQLGFHAGHVIPFSQKTHFFHFLKKLISSIFSKNSFHVKIYFDSIIF